MPFFVFQGAVDNVTPAAPVRDYVESITAPRKELILILNAGHNAMVTRSDEFLKLLLDRVRPSLSNPSTEYRVPCTECRAPSRYASCPFTHSSSRHTHSTMSPVLR